MSLLPNELASGSTAVIPMLTEAGPTQPYFAPASGGGGGGGGPVLTVSTINLNPVGQVNMRNAGSGGQGGFNGAFLAFDKDPGPNVTVWMGYNTVNDSIQITQESGAGLASASLQVDAILCSSINGQLPNSAVIPENLSVNSLTASTLTVVSQSQGDSQNLVLTVDEGNNVNFGGGIANVQMDALKTSTINLSGFSVPLFQNGRFVMPNAPSNVIETDIIFSGTDWGAWAGYDGAVNSAVSSIGTSVLSRSTFAVYAQGGLGVSWQVLGN